MPLTLTGITLMLLGMTTKPPILQDKTHMMTTKPPTLQDMKENEGHILDQLWERENYDQNNQLLKSGTTSQNVSCDSTNLTKYKMVSTTIGEKFMCPREDTIKSCRCPMTYNNGTKTGKLTEVPHSNPNNRVCSCQELVCGPDCRKIVTRAVCCSPVVNKCPINSVQKPRHRKDWVCRIDVRRSFGTSVTQIRSAVNIAIDYVNDHPREQVELYFRPGTYLLDSKDQPTFHLKNVKPENNGRLIIAGAGKDLTTLKFVDWKSDMIYANNVTKMTVRDLHLTRSTPGVTQGYVREVTENQVTLEIPPGFPLPNQIYNGEYETKTRTYLRRFVNDSDPQMVLVDNPQIPWVKIHQVNESNSQLWAFTIKKFIGQVNYQEGDLIGVKSKCCGSPRSCSYFFKNSREILFERVKWTRQSRGVFRLGTNHVTIKDCEIARDPPIQGRGWCLSTSGGGPQFGQPGDPLMYKVWVENFKAENTGDDSLAFFKVAGNASVTNAYIRDAFARSILLFKSNMVELNNVTTVRSPICYNDDEEEIRKIYDFDDNARQIKIFHRFNRNRFSRDPDGLRSSNCSLEL